MEQPEQISVEKNLERLTVRPGETENEKEVKESSMTSQPKNHDKENRKFIQKDKAVDILPEEEKKKSVRQSDRSVSSTSTCSSVNDSSPESDQVFSEEEEIQSKRKTLRKVRNLGQGCPQKLLWGEAEFVIFFAINNLLRFYDTEERTEQVQYECSTNQLQNKLFTHL